jgi:hypothetical protein
VVQDTPDLIAVYLCPGTRWKVPGGSRDQFGYLLQMIDITWTLGDTLCLIHPGEAHAVHVMWGQGNREFMGWYINLQELVRRTAIGFDFMDQELDIVVSPDLSEWTWKDEERFQRDEEMGLVSALQAREIRAEAERVIGRIRAKASPFNEGWEDWRPPSEWPIPCLPDGWDKL